MKKIITIILITMISISAVYSDSIDVNQNLIDEIINIIEDSYKYDVEREDLINGAYRGILNELDTHSTYFSKKEYKEFIESMHGEIVGIGVFIEPIGDYIKVITPIEGTPAYEGGIESEDIIIKVDGVDVKEIGYEKAVDSIKGKEGTEVKITVLRRDKEIEFKLIRQKINAPDITEEMINKDIGYIRMIQFGDNVAEELDESVKKLEKEGAKKLIIDLRNNPGGYLDQVIKALDIFLDKGQEILTVKANRNQTYKAMKDGKDIPIVILVNKGSASASEIFAGTMQSHNKAVILGETTYGKGTVQTIYNLSDGSALKMTTAEFFLPNDVEVKNIGVTPNIVVKHVKSEVVEKLEDLCPMESSVVDHYGKISLNIFAAQQRLDILGYDITPNAKYDGHMARILLDFQNDYKLKYKNGLFPETIDKLNELIKNLDNEDPQLSRAITILENDK